MVNFRVYWHPSFHPETPAANYRRQQPKGEQALQETQTPEATPEGQSQKKLPLQRQLFLYSLVLPA